jgi:hypothetical protein
LASEAAEAALHPQQRAGWRIRRLPPHLHRDDPQHAPRRRPTLHGRGRPCHTARCEDDEIAWLRKRGLRPINIPFAGDLNPLSDVLEMMRGLAHGAPFILGCTSSNGCNHSVVIQDGEVHNPNDGHIAGPMRDGYWWLTIYSVGPNWRSPRWRDRLKDWFRNG